MTIIVACLPFLVFLIGLVLYFICLGLTKGTVGEVGRIMVFAGLLTFLLSAGASMQSCSIVNGGATVQHR
jgi:hypothetical protein